ncbi:integrase arm-type DNA-binding domain-containing protein [Xanthomonas euvesicatoria]|uniref:integrase arm-type DNA-binding domain-containing protein n=1 Tax=Xanthomonas euvesicatoria TaxID=456327 RepID=UPI001C477D29|nr:integrase arm-type DNA-binding domain-containing protein [Xanthomonas euvesicatoria]MBV6807464.1 integrase family protein [Xanthomonas campestris pv. convolvuli]
MTKTATSASKRAGSLKFNLTYNQVLALSLTKAPAWDAQGKVRLAPRSEGRPYLVLDGGPGAPSGFGFRVGSTMTTYVGQKRGPDGKPIRFTLGNVADMPLDEAREVCREHLALLKQTGKNPVHVKRRQLLETQERESEKEFGDLTLREGMERYIAHLDSRAKNKKIKPVSVDAVRDSLSRLSRPTVALSDKTLSQLQLEVIQQAFDACRISSMQLSNRIPREISNKLAEVEDWAKLTVPQLEALGITGKYIQRVRAAGLSSTEHTFSDARRAVDFIIEEEKARDHQFGRPQRHFYNPLVVIHTRDMLREAHELRSHYSRAEVRNPLDDKTLPKVLKAIAARRDEQGGRNAAGADYLLLTLLWGTRRSEAAPLRWYDRCTPGELSQELVSWVWLAAPGEINPTTKRAGSQVYLFETKNKEQRFLPVTYFAERVLQRRFNEREDDGGAKKGLEAAKAALTTAIKRGGHAALIETLQAAVANTEHALDRTRFVFPARSRRSKSGHYSDSKSIIANVRRDAGLIDLREEVDIGLTPHDLRRTLGRYAERLHSGKARVVSQMLHHRVKDKNSASTDAIYTEQEWAVLREAFALVEEHMMASSPRVWNRWKGTDKPRLDEVNDPPATIFAARNQKVAFDDED